MRIVLCYERVLPTRGGAETYIRDLACRLIRDGHNVHLIASEWDSSLPMAIHYHRIPVIYGMRLQRHWRFTNVCLKYLKNIPHDLSIGFDKIYGLDIVYPQGGLYYASSHYNLFKYDNWLERLASRCVKCFDLTYWSHRMLEYKQYCINPPSLVIVNSDMVRRHFVTYYRFDPARIRVVHNAVDEKRFMADDRLRRRFEERQRWGVSPDAIVGLFVAMNYRLKGLIPLLRAITRVRHPVFHLVVVGHPNYRRYLRLAQRWGIADRVHFLGHRLDPRDCYFAADFLVHPTFYDPCSLVVLEAFACSLPIITTQYNGAAELLRYPMAGIIIDNPHNTEALTAAIQKMCDAGYRREASVASRLCAESWNFDKHYQALLSAFQEVYQSKSAA